MPLDINSKILPSTNISSLGVFKKKITLDGLLFHIDAADVNSYPGTGATWTDLTGNGNNFTLNGSYSFSSDFGGHFNFNGTNAYASANSMVLTNGFTMEAWIYMNDSSSFGVFGQGVYGTGQGMHLLYQSGPRGMIFGLYANDNDYANNYRPSTNQWYHWVWTYNASSYKKRFYANTVIQTPGSSAETVYTGTGQVNFGAIYSAALSPGNGKFAIARGYNRELNPYEVSQNYQAQKARFFPVYSVGQTAQGGIIAYILQPGDPGYDANVQHGLVVTANNVSNSADWGCYGTVLGASGIAIGTGNANTNTIVAGCADSNIAAKLCADLVEGGYSDWYLPSYNELLAIFTNKDAIGNLTSTYWSSTEGSDIGYPANVVRTVSPYGGSYNYRYFTSAVRAVRSF